MTSPADIFIANQEKSRGQAPKIVIFPVDRVATIAEVQTVVTDVSTCEANRSMELCGIASSTQFFVLLAKQMVKRDGAGIREARIDVEMRWRFS